MSKLFGRRILFFQPALPKYRVDFFQRLYETYGEDFRLLYAKSALNVSGHADFKWAFCTGEIKKLFFGFFVQPGINCKVRVGDIIVISGNIRNLTSLRLFILARLCGATVVWWGHYRSAGGSRSGLFIRRMFMQFADAVLFYVDGEVEKFRTSVGKKAYIPITCALNNGINVAEIEPLVADYITSERDIDFIFIGRLTDKAAVHLLLDALSEAHDSFNLHVVGDGLLKPSLINRAKELGLSERVVWHGAISDERQISILMNRSKVFVYPGEVGLSLIHAMAYGLPAILHSSIDDQMPEFDAFEDGVTGFSFVHDEFESLAVAMRFALSDPDKLYQMSINSISRVGPNFTTEGMAQRFCSLVDLLRSQSQKIL